MEKLSDEKQRGPDEAALSAINTLLHSHDHHNGGAVNTGVSWSNLSVFAPKGAASTPVKTLPRAILNTFGPDQFRWVKTHIVDKFIASKKEIYQGAPILNGLTGRVEPGEMLLVLGRPGSGCSTFLRTAANSSPLPLTGSLSYGGADHDAFRKRHPRASIYLPEEDHHIAALSVRQTLSFALRTSLPSAERSAAKVNELVLAISKLLGLGHVLESPVGGAFVPGVSGGERKRVSIAEVLAAGSSVHCFDNSTSGLDSSTALDFVKALRAFTDAGQKTTLATLYQAGENLWRHFDKVLLLHDGHGIYFGSTSTARSYFENLGFTSLPGQTTAEFLLSVTDPAHRQCASGSVAEAAPTAAGLAALFRESELYPNELGPGHDTDELSKSDSYNLSYPVQVFECFRRETQLAWAQRRVYYTKWLTTVILCLACGSIYFDITATAQGAFTRGGIIFFALIFNGWLQFPELFDSHTNRSVLERQARLHMNRPSAVALARFLIDLPLIAFQHVVFIIPFYFLTRLQVDAGKFFFFYLTMYISTINFSNLLRMFAYYVESLDDCFRYGGFSCTVLLLFAGFLIPASEMRPYFGWLHWINPMYYAFENLFVNEFYGLTLDCQTPIPNIPGADPRYQSCAIRGATPGVLNVPGEAYAQSYGFVWADRWRNIGIMIAIAAAYLLAGVFGAETMSFSGAFVPRAVVPRAPGASRGRSQDDSDGSQSPPDMEKSAPAAKSRDDISSYHPELALTWTDLAVDIGDRTILQDINGYIRRGELTALCGASGAGKTTLLSALSKTNFQGVLHGDVRVGNSQAGEATHIGYAQQMDLHDTTATVKEALEFAALLRQPATYSRQEKLAYVQHILETLDLKSLENTLIGEPGGRLSVEQLKRVTIAVELASRPRILFADEPTSGLDSQGAAHIIDYLRKLSRQGQAIIVTVHQPSALLFSQFDNLLVLSSGGRQIYFGNVQRAIPYFEHHGANCPPDENPAEFILETIGAGVNARTTTKGSDWATNWVESTEQRDLRALIESNKSTVGSGQASDDSSKMYNASTIEQTGHLTFRMLRNQWRNTPYVYSKIWVHLISAILVGFTFYNLGTSPSELQNRAFSVYFILFLVNAIVNVILARYFFASLYWRFREGPSHTYGWIAFCSACILAELPAAVVVTVIYFLLFYFPTGLPMSEAGYIFLFLLTYEVFQVLLGLFMMAISPDLGVAGNVLVFLVCTMNWFNGIIVPYDQIQIFWRYWLYYLSPFTYLLGGMVTAVVSGLAVECNANDLTYFDAPPGQTCSSYAGAWATANGAQLTNPNASRSCAVCPYTNGDQYLEEFRLGPAIAWGGKWQSWGIFVGFTISNLTLVYLFTWATKVRNWKLFYFF